MTDITLEQRAAHVATLGEMFQQCANDRRMIEADALAAAIAALRLSAGADWVLVPLDAVTAAATELTFADREGAAADLLNAMLAAAPKPEDS